jgi:hypothetical protein
MRILHLDSGKQMRGGQWQVLRLIQGLAESGVESTLLARARSPLFLAASERKWPVQPLGIFSLLTNLRSHDLIHAHDSRSHTLALLAPSRPLVVSRRVAFPIGSSWKYARAGRYLAVSEFVKRVLIAGGVSADKIAVVYDGVPILDPAHGDRILGLEKDSALLAPLGVEPVTDLQRQLPTAKLLVYITHCEGLGSGALLAMSAGVPVIASNLGGLPEIIHHGENGLLVENTTASISTAIRLLTEDSAGARQIGSAARHTVIERFSIAQMVARTLDNYREVLS